MAAQESAEQPAERMIRERLAVVGWSQADFATRLKKDETKARMTERMRAEITMPWTWNAARLVMGHWRIAARARAAEKPLHPASHLRRHAPRLPKRPQIPNPRGTGLQRHSARHICRSPNHNKIFSPVGPAYSGNRTSRYVPHANHLLNISPSIPPRSYPSK